MTRDKRGVQDPILEEARKTLDARLRADPYFMSRAASLCVTHQYRSLYSTYKSARVLLQNKLPHVPLSDVPVKRVRFLLLSVILLLIDFALVCFCSQHHPVGYEVSSGLEMKGVLGALRECVVQIWNSPDFGCYCCAPWCRAHRWPV